MFSKHLPFSKYYFEILASNFHSPINDDVQVVEGAVQILFGSEELHFSQEKEGFNKRLIKVREERVASPELSLKISKYHGFHDFILG